MENKNKEGAYAQLKGFHRAVPIILAAFALFITLCYFTKNSTGAFGEVISGFLLGTFSIGGYFIPVLFAVHAIFYPSDITEKRLVSRVVFSVILLVFISAMSYAFSIIGEEPVFSAADFYHNGQKSIGGGFIGGVIGFAVIKVIGHVGLIILAFAIIALYITYFLSGEKMRRMLNDSLLAFVKFGAKIEGKFKKSAAEKKANKAIRAEEKRRAEERKNAKRLEALMEKESELFEDDFFATDNGLKELHIPELGISESRDQDDIELNPTLQEKVHPKSKVEEEPEYVRIELHPKKTIKTDYGFDPNEVEYNLENDGRDFVAEEQPVSKQKPVYNGFDDSAASVFTSDFDGFDFAKNERLASKQSTMGQVEVEKKPRVEETIDHVFTEDDIEKARKRASFEMRKAELAKQREAEEARKRAEAEFEPVTVEFDINPEMAPKNEAEEVQIYAEAVNEAADEAPAYTETVIETADEAPAYTETVIETSDEAPAYTETVIETADEAPATSAYDESIESRYRRAAEYAGIISNYPRTEEAEKRANVAEERAREAERRAKEAEERAKEAERRALEAEKAREEAHRAPAAQPVYYVPVQNLEPMEEKKVEQAPVYTSPEKEPAYAAAERTKSYVVYDDEDEDEDEGGEVFTGNENEPVIDIAKIVESEDFDDDNDSFVYDDAEIPESEQNPQVLEYRKMFPCLDEEEKEETSYQSAPAAQNELDDVSVDEDDDEEENDPYAYTYRDQEDEPFTAVAVEEEDDEDEPPFDFTPVTSRDGMPAPAPVEDVEEKKNKPDYSNFKFPSLEILKKGTEEEDDSIAEEISEYGDKLIDALDQFDVRASIKSVDRGPRITRYEIVPARGVRVSRVISLFDDIALNLAAEGIRMEAPIPGKSAIGVEIPNKHPSTVFLRDLLETDEFKNEKSKTLACIGKDVTGNPVFGDIAKMPHILIAGATGMGKSVCINSILISILYRARPDEVKLIMIDPKTVEFTMYNGIPHLLVPVVTDAKQAAGALMWAIDEMNRRYELMAKHEVRKLDSYNDLVREKPELGEPLPKIIIVIDELNDLMQQVRKPVEGLITNITQKARAAGIHMIIGTQRPSVDVITGVIKANIPSRISCKVTSLTDSRTILDQQGAEKLLDKGDVLFAPVGIPKPKRVQCAFVSDSEVEQVMKHLKSTVKGDVYDEEALAEMTRAAQKCNKGKDDDDRDDDDGAEEGASYLNDKQFLEAVDLAIKSGKISTSLIQRKISIGYGKAAKFIDIMEDLGIVSEPNGQKPRDVLVTRDEWHEMLSRRSLDD